MVCWDAVSYTHLTLPTTNCLRYRRATVSVAMHDGWCGFGISRIIPTENSARRALSDLTFDGVVGYFREGGLLASMFEQFCTRNLCAESWDFIVEACKYEVHTYGHHDVFWNRDGFKMSSTRTKAP